MSNCCWSSLLHTEIRGISHQGLCWRSEVLGCAVEIAQAVQRPLCDIITDELDVFDLLQEPFQRFLSVLFECLSRYSSWW